MDDFSFDVFFPYSKIIPGVVLWVTEATFSVEDLKAFEGSYFIYFYNTETNDL